VRSHSPGFPNPPKTPSFGMGLPRVGVHGTPPTGVGSQWPCPRVGCKVREADPLMSVISVVEFGRRVYLSARSSGLAPSISCTRLVSVAIARFARVPFIVLRVANGAHPVHSQAHSLEPILRRRVMAPPVANTTNHRKLLPVVRNVNALSPPPFSYIWWRRPIHSKGARTSAASTPIGPLARL
jgi:hypothetical protein